MLGLWRSTPRSAKRPVLGQRNRWGTRDSNEKAIVSVSTPSVKQIPCDRIRLMEENCIAERQVMDTMLYTINSVILELR